MFTVPISVYLLYDKGLNLSPRPTILAQIWTVHCEKSLFVLASRQKIPILREENPALSTRTIFLLPIEFLKITHARKATAENSWPKTTYTAGKFWPSGLWRDTFYIPSPEKVMPENPGK
jgi:hypothetical protein